MMRCPNGTLLMPTNEAAFLLSPHTDKQDGQGRLDSRAFLPYAAPPNSKNSLSIVVELPIILMGWFASKALLRA